MRRIITICALCATAFAGASALAMPLGVRTLLHAHAAARQAETPSQPQEGVSVDVGGGKTVTVPEAWLAAHEEILQESGGDAVAALQAPAANKRLTVAQCYILGLDPEEPESDFRIVSFPMGTDGKPDISKIEFEPDEGEWNVSGARAVLKGAPSLGDATWKAVEGASDDEKAAFRFFKVEVELP